MERVRLLIAGDVQGVGFRYAACRTADALSLTGWVRNLPDGRVETEAEGPRDALERFAAWCGQGPGGARVMTVEAQWGEASGSFTGFKVTY